METWHTSTISRRVLTSTRSVTVHKQLLRLCSLLSCRARVDPAYGPLVISRLAAACRVHDPAASQYSCR